MQIIVSTAISLSFCPLMSLIRRKLRDHIRNSANN